MKFAAVLTEASRRFAEAGIESHQADAELLLAFFLGINRGEVLAKAIAGEQLSEDQVKDFDLLVTKREQRFPLQHLTGTAAFRKLELEVGPGVFVPRFETEVVTGIAIDLIRDMQVERPIVVDLATGSGAIALSIAVELPSSRVFACELSIDALKYTERNFAKYGPKAELRQGDLADAFPDLDGQVDLVISNPPYIPDDMVPIYPEVQLHDPKLALYGGNDGLDIVRKVEVTAKRLLKPGGRLVIEHADMQGESVRAILLATGWQEVMTHQDLAGRDRAVSARR